MMKRFLLFCIFSISLLSSCKINWHEPFDPREPNHYEYPQPPSGGNNGGNNGGTGSNTGGNNNADSVPQSNPSSGKDTTQQVVNTVTYPGYFYDSCTVNGVLKINVYIGYEVAKKTVYIGNYPRTGGAIEVTLYPNSYSMSMYGFSKYATDFYYFVDDDTYSGLNSYSNIPQSCCKYKIIIKPNETNAMRSCSGYWTCYDSSFGYSSFYLIVDQKG